VACMAVYGFLGVVVLVLLYRHVASVPLGSYSDAGSAELPRVPAE
jgi:hypothetical protein